MRGKGFGVNVRQRNDTRNTAQCLSPRKRTCEDKDTNSSNSASGEAGRAGRGVRWWRMARWQRGARGAGQGAHRPERRLLNGKVDRRTKLYMPWRSAVQATKTRKLSMSLRRCVLAMFKTLCAVKRAKNSHWHCQCAPLALHRDALPHTCICPASADSDSWQSPRVKFKK